MLGDSEILGDLLAALGHRAGGAMISGAPVGSPMERLLLASVVFLSRSLSLDRYRNIVNNLCDQGQVENRPEVRTSII